MALGEVNDRSGIIIKIGVFDTQGAPITLTSGTWTLVTDEETPVVINSRDQVTLPTRNADNYYYVGLTGDDTAFSDGSTRYFILEAQYYNSLTESVLDVKKYETFIVTDLRYIV